SKPRQSANRFFMKKIIPTQSARANASASTPSFLLGTKLVLVLAALGVTLFIAGCGTQSPPATSKAEAKPVAPAIPAEIDDAAKALLGSSAQVLVFGDLAKTGKQQFLAANEVPKTPNSKVAGLVVTRAIIAENNDGKWTEVLHCDEYLKNAKGYLGRTPVSPVTGWKLQFEQSPMLGLQLYFTQVPTAVETTQPAPIAVRWNPTAKRYQD